MVHTGTVRIGIAGWTYAPWRGVFYPKGLTQRRELEYATSQFSSLEVNGTFYGMQRPDAFAGWADCAPHGFMFAVKAPRFITHIRRLREVETPLANFIASGLLRLGGKLGPILWQFPPNFRLDPERLEAFLKLLPHDTKAAARLGGKHDDRLKAPVCADAVGWPRLMDLTSDFVYCRLHGSEQLYASGYDDSSLDEWAERSAIWASGGEPADAERIGDAGSRRKRDVFVYFDNDMKVRAPFDAKALTERVEQLLRRGQA
jgi:uncharacterized protein YecE (DUF72 family)